LTEESKRLYINSHSLSNKQQSQGSSCTLQAAWTNLKNSKQRHQAIRISGKSWREKKEGRKHKKGEQNRKKAS
jgi:hypothetical protein